MTQVILDIEDDKLNAFITFIKTLNYVSVAKSDDIPQWQKDEVNKSIKEIDNSTIIYEDWEVTRKRLFEKNDLK
jgi:hypothetical protein